MEHPDYDARQQGIDAFLTPGRRKVMDKLEELAFWVGSQGTAVRVGTAAEERYNGNHHITQLLTRKTMKQCEVAESVLDDLRAGRCGSAFRSTRTLLEGAVELSWAADSNLKQSPEDRLLRILRRAYEDLAARGQLPVAEARVLGETKRRNLKLSPESAKNAMEEMDAAETRDGGSAYWIDHYRHFEASSDYVHASFLGPGRFTIEGDYMRVDMNPDALEGVAALRWGLFYFVRSADGVFRLVGLDEDAKRVAAAYGAVKDLAEQELEAVLDGNDGEKATNG